MTRTRIDTWASASFGAVSGAVVAVGLVLFSLADMTNFGVGSPERYAYGLLLLLTATALVASIRMTTVRQADWLFAASWLLLVALFTIPVVQQRYVYPSYILGDALSLLLPLSFILIGWSWRRLFSIRTAWTIGAGLLIASLLALVLGRSGSRFEPPPTLLIALVWWTAASRLRVPARAAAWTTALALGYLANIVRNRFLEERLQDPVEGGREASSGPAGALGRLRGVCDVAIRRQRSWTDSHGISRDSLAVDATNNNIARRR